MRSGPPHWTMSAAAGSYVRSLRTSNACRLRQIREAADRKTANGRRRQPGRHRAGASFAHHLHTYRIGLTSIGFRWQYSMDGHCQGISRVTTPMRSE
jgi:hypothetical protein